MRSMYTLGFLSILAFCFGLSSLFSQEPPRWMMQNSGTKASLRALSAYSDSLIWFGGSQGTLGFTKDGGQHWQTVSPLPQDSLDFRDIEVLTPDRIIAMSAGEGEKSRIYLSKDQGKTWKEVYRNPYPEGFFDGFAFWNEQEGILAGDPIEGKLFVLKTTDGGETWQRIPSAQFPPLKEKEYGFAASGTHLCVAQDSLVWIGTGGEHARVFYSSNGGKDWAVSTTPILQGNASSGIFSLAFRDAQLGIGVGGDYTEESTERRSIIRSTDGGKSWELVSTSEPIFRSAVVFWNGNLIAVGQHGASISADGGKYWDSFGEKGFHTLSLSKYGNSLWAAGANGQLARLK